VKAVAVGTAIAALVPFGFLVALLLAIYSWAVGDLRNIMLIAVAAVGIPLLVVLLASTFVGLPTWFVLQRINGESAVAYILAGTASGAVIMLLLFGLPIDWLVPLGAAAGGVTAYVWWHYGPVR
jgi:hypothetical protein